MTLFFDRLWVSWLVVHLAASLFLSMWHRLRSWLWQQRLQRVDECLKRLRCGAPIISWHDDRLIRKLYQANSDLVIARQANAEKTYRKDSISCLEAEEHRLRAALGLNRVVTASIPESSDEVPSASA